MVVRHQRQRRRGCFGTWLRETQGAHRILARPSPPHDSYMGVDDAKDVDSHAQVLFSAVCTSSNLQTRSCEYESVIYDGDESVDDGEPRDDLDVRRFEGNNATVLLASQLRLQEAAIVARGD